MDENKIISLENLNQYSDETSDKIKSYVDTKTSVIQDGTKTVGGVTAEDYNKFTSAYEDKHTHSNKSVLDEISEKTLNGGAELSGSTGYTVTDSVEYPLVGLKVFGKSTQDGTPTPENPVDIVSVENPTVNVFNTTSINVLKDAQQNWIKEHIDIVNDRNKIAIFTEGEKQLMVFDNETIVDGNGVVCYYKFYVITELGEVKYYNKRPIYTNLRIDTIKSCENVKITTYKGEFRNINKTSDVKFCTLPLPYTLNAIPVSSGGNVTIDGQEYIADYVDFGEGKYHKLVDPNKLAPTVSIVDNLDLLLASEEITDISKAEMLLYRQLQTYNGITNISNDKGAGLSVKYCTNKALSACVAPITTGLQKQIEELKAAILSLGGNV